MVGQVIATTTVVKLSYRNFFLYLFFSIPYSLHNLCPSRDTPAASWLRAKKSAGLFDLPQLTENGQAGGVVELAPLSHVGLNVAKWQGRKK